MLAPVRSDPASLKRLAVIDGLRAMAILMVLGFHLWGLLPGLSGGKATALLDTHLARLFGVGWTGVDLFFVVSGFLLTGNLYDARGSPTYFRSFYARRFLRVFPLYYVFLAVLLFVVPLLPSVGSSLQIAPLRKAQLYYWTYTVNIAGSFRATSNQIPLAYTHIWSLCVEEQFYLIWPAIVLYAGDRRRLMRLFLGLMAIALVTRFVLTLDAFAGVLGPAAPYSLLPCRMDSFAFGGYLALVLRGDSGEIARIRRVAPVLVGIAVLGLGAIFLGQQGLRPLGRLQVTIDFPLLALGFGGLLVMVLDSKPHGAWRTVFESRPLRTVATLSYGLYVVHLAVAFALIRYVAHTWWTKPVGGSLVFANLGFTLLAGAASLCVAWMSWHLLEKRCIALKRYVPYGTPRMRAATPDRARVPDLGGPYAAPTDTAQPSCVPISISEDKAG
jgi:peptidoglycan/LPS O-acetylase OafA/YrhL